MPDISGEEGEDGVSKILRILPRPLLLPGFYPIWLLRKVKTETIFEYLTRGADYGMGVASAEPDVGDGDGGIYSPVISPVAGDDDKTLAAMGVAKTISTVREQVTVIVFRSYGHPF